MARLMDCDSGRPGVTQAQVEEMLDQINRYFGAIDRSKGAGHAVGQGVRGPIYMRLLHRARIVLTELTVAGMRQGDMVLTYNALDDYPEPDTAPKPPRLSRREGRTLLLLKEHRTLLEPQGSDEATLVRLEDKGCLDAWWGITDLGEEALDAFTERD